MDELHEFRFGVNGKDSPEFRVFEGERIVEYFPFAKQPVDGGTLVGDAADKFFGQIMGHGEINHVLG